MVEYVGGELFTKDMFEELCYFDVVYEIKHSLGYKMLVKFGLESMDGAWLKEELNLQIIVVYLN